MAAATNTTRGNVKLAGDLAGSNDADNPQLPASGVTSGVYTNPVITLNSKGLITNISTGTAIDVFNVPLATSSVLGTVKVGAGFSIAGDGTLSMPLATTATPGIVQVGTGLTVSSGTVSIDGALYPSVQNGYQYSGAIITAIVNLTGVTGSTTLNFASSNTYQLSLVGNVTLNAPSNLIAGGTYFIVFRQDATGSRTCTFNSVFKFESGSPTTLSTAANSVDVLRVTVVSGTELVCKLYKNFA